MRLRMGVLVCTWLFIACEPESVGKAKVTFSLRSVSGASNSSPAPHFMAGAAAGLQVATLQPHEIVGVSFTPESVFVPITRIALNGHKYEIYAGEKRLNPASGSVDIYTCTGAQPSDCLVEISSPAAMAALSQSLKNVPIEEGVYETISVYNGFGDGAGFVKGHVKAKGSFQINDVTYYTSIESPVTESSQMDYVEMEISKGDWVFPVQANGTLEVVADEPATVSLFANYDALLLGQQISDLGASEENGCSVNTALEVGVCVSQPALVGYVGEVAPVLETYILTFSGSGWYDNMTGMLLMVVDPASQSVIGILPKQYLNGAIGGKSPNFFGAIETFTVNSDGSLDFQNGEPGANGYFSVSGFARKNHEGSMVLEGNGPGQYKAEKMPNGPLKH